MIPLLAALPLLAAFILMLLDVLKVKRTVIKGVFLLGALLPVPVVLLNGLGSEIVGGWAREAGIEVALTRTNLPFIAGELVLFIFVALYSLYYFDFRNKKTPKVLALLLLLHTGLMGAFIARDFFNFYIYSEIASVSAFALVAFSDEKGSKRAAFRYLIMSLLASYLFVFAVGIIYMETGYLNVDLVRESAGPSRELNTALALAFTSLLLKAGIFPLHSWLPDAHSSAPTPVSAVLSGAVVKAPAYGMILLLSALPSGETFRAAVMGVAVASIFFGIAGALFQQNAKRFLAYSTVSQMGYVLLGVGSLNFLGAAYYAMAHSIFKGGLFLAVGSLGRESRKLGEFGYRNAPVMAVSVLTLSLAIGGIGPFVGAYGKELLYESLSGPWKLAVPLGSIGTLTSFAKLNHHLRRGEAPGMPAAWKLSSLGLALAALLTGVYLGARVNPRDVLYLSSALPLFALLKWLGVLGRSPGVGPREIGRDVNILTAVFVMMTIAMILLQGV
ncbi:proton-conducting transporter transmembrane domain-containing protein [Thermococcus aciditolerans]|uniref:Monovalent cation/H+ antiporter subunit D family protein n=1 Tax=Thermococcus aciditolerans TaxID=2598455 RepID=A0A5C0SRJ2_9EURY|nr:proton-conducting transporter membrane subunit [Thermococcus aciditolerans]QEK15519.1 monovalent cation/H+ antiporter subunit D family protein [Thermococcus aciditolerans]